MSLDVSGSRNQKRVYVAVSFLYLTTLFLIFHCQLLSNPDLITNTNLYHGPHCQFRQTSPISGNTAPS